MGSTSCPIDPNTTAGSTTQTAAPSASTPAPTLAAGGSGLSTGPPPDSPLLNVSSNKTRAGSRSPSSSTSLTHHGHYVVPSEETAGTAPKPCAAQPAKPITIKLCILSPSYPEPFYMHVSPHHTSVAQLKAMLASSHPARPSLVDARLVYRGHILNDLHLIIEYLKGDVHDFEKEAIHIHLVLGRSALSMSPHSASAPAFALPPTPASEYAASHAAPASASASMPRRQPSLTKIKHFSESIALPLTSISTSCLCDCDALANYILAFDPQPGQLFVIESLLYKYTLWNGFPYLIPIYEQSVENQTGPSWAQSQSTSAAAAEEQAAPAAMAAGEAAPRRPGSIGLAIKLLFFLFIFTQRAGVLKSLILCLLTVFIFLHQTGRLVIVRRQPTTADAPTRQSSDSATVLAEAEMSIAQKIKTVVFLFVASIVPTPGIPLED